MVWTNPLGKQGSAASSPVVEEELDYKEIPKGKPRNEIEQGQLDCERRLIRWMKGNREHLLNIELMIKKKGLSAEGEQALVQILQRHRDVVGHQ